MWGSRGKEWDGREEGVVRGREVLDGSGGVGEYKSASDSFQTAITFPSTLAVGAWQVVAGIGTKANP